MHVPLGDTYYFKFPTRGTTGAPTTLSGTPVISVYEENNLVQITAGITLTVDYDGVTGLNDVAIVATTANGYEVGKYYNAVITTGTVGGTSVVGEVVGHFRMMPAEDAGAGITDVNVTNWNDSAVAVPTVAGIPEVDVTHWIGAAAATPTVAGVPEVDLTHWLGTAAATPTVAGVPEVDITHFGGSAGTFAAGRAEVNASHWAGTATTLSATTSKPEVDVYSVSDDATAANTLELQYDGTGLVGDKYPANQAQVTSIASTSSFLTSVVTDDNATGTNPLKGVTFVGAVATGTYAVTKVADGVVLTINAVGNIIDYVAEITIPISGVPLSIDFAGYLNSTNDICAIQVYDNDTTSWVVPGSLVGQGGTSNKILLVPLGQSRYVSNGKVYVRFLSTATDTQSLSIDRLLCNYYNQTVGYANGAYSINTVKGESGTAPFVNGTVDNPVNSLADAQTLSAAIPLNVYTVSNESSITPVAPFENSIMTGSGYTLAFNGQSFSGSRVVGAVVSGVATGAAGLVLNNCVVNAVTLPITAVESCNIEGGITLGSAGEYHIHNSHCGNANGVYIDFGAALGDNQLLVHGWQGELELRNMGQLGTDVAHVAGDGILTIASSCVGGTVYYQGDWDFTDNSGGAVTFVKSDYNNNIASLLTNVASVKSDTAATKTKTDQMTFTKANELDTNIHSINDITITGDGSGTPFDV